MSADLSTRGAFIVVEGIDGSGSTTQGDKLTNWLRASGRNTYFTREPSSGPVGMLIRLALARRLTGANHKFHDPTEKKADSAPNLDAQTMALLYATDRSDHIATEILPNLNSGKIVVCDRYLLSTLAYQGLEMDEEWLFSINKNFIVPDITICLDVSVENATSRMRRTRWTKDLYEEEDQLLLIRDRYLSLIERRDARLGPIHVIDSSASMDEVSLQIQRLVEPVVGRYK
jgi:dTMP kinase